MQYTTNKDIKCKPTQAQKCGFADNRKYKAVITQNHK